MPSSRRFPAEGRVALLLVVAVGLGVALFRVGGLLPASRPTHNAQPSAGVEMSLEQISLEITLGRKDRQSTDWSGRLTVRAGELIRLRLLDDGQLPGAGRWIAHSKPQPPGRRRARRSSRPAPVRLLATLSGDQATRINVETPAGQFTAQLAELSLTSARTYLKGAASVLRVPLQRQLTDSAQDEDFPALARADNGAIWCALATYHRGTPIDESETAQGRFESLRTRGNGDQIQLMRYSAGQWTDPVNVTGRGRDAWRPAVAVARDGSVWTVWSQQVEGNWDLYARRFEAGRARLGPIHRLTDHAEADLQAVVTTSSAGQVWLAWQACRDGQFDIRAARLTEAGRLSQQQVVSASAANDWNPAIAPTADAAVWVAWDTYHKGDYDVYARRLGRGAGQPVPIATSDRFEARPSIAVDRQNRPWIAFEDAGANWGKDHGPRMTGDGVPFYYEKKILVRCLNGGLKQTAAPESPLIYTHYDDTRYEAEFKQRISMPRLCLDGNGTLWLLYRRHPDPARASGERWASYAQYLRSAWSGEIALPHSTNLLDNRPALAPLPTGDLLVVHSTDGRDSNARSAKVNNLFASVLRADQPARTGPLEAVRPQGNVAPTPPADPEEVANVQRCRAYRIEAGGKTYQLLRGEFHRHTEISSHRDWDGPLEEVWRYGLDAADMDWIGPGDHDYAVSHEYMWWLTQKQIDLYHMPGSFLTMYTYERSKGYPSGHRNVMFTQRGIRTLPTIAGRDNTFGTPEQGAPDIQNLYKYLKYFGGICSSHTSATNMGTDWRDSDPQVEPVVEIFQGHRQNYEETTAPLAARGPEDTIQGYRPAGFVWEAFKKGIRLGFQSSSDHVSTHTSYAFVLAERRSREAIVAALQKRHSYAANDNIVLDVRCGPHIMGDEFRWSGRPTLQIQVIGTAPIADLDIVRQSGDGPPAYVYNASPRQKQVQLRWTDKAAAPGLNMYYVRIQQSDQRLAWASPMWIHIQD